jgi:hypothetical protein
LGSSSSLVCILSFHHPWKIKPFFCFGFSYVFSGLHESSRMLRL